MLDTSQTCKLVLAAWLSHLQESSWVAIDNTGEVVGYLIMSKITVCWLMSTEVLIHSTPEVSVPDSMPVYAAGGVSAFLTTPMLGTSQLAS